MFDPALVILGNRITSRSIDDHTMRYVAAEKIMAQVTQVKLLSTMGEIHLPPIKIDPALTKKHFLGIGYGEQTDIHVELLFELLLLVLELLDKGAADQAGAY